MENNMSNPDNTNLTDEELEALKKITEKLLIDNKQFEENFPPQFDPLEYSKTQYKEIFDKQAFLDAPVELVFMVSCNVLNKNNKGEIISTSQAVLENYYIPLNNENQAKACIDKFFSKFKGDLQTAAQETVSNDTTKEKAK